MARIDSLSIQLQSDSTYNEKLAELYGKVIDNIEKSTISALLKNTDLSGDPTTGTVEAKRFANISGQAYGTARSGGAAQKINALPVVISLNTDKEYIEEVEEKDLRTYGINGLLARRTANHESAIRRDLERAFFEEAYASGTEFETAETDIEKIIEAAVQSVETTKNDFVDGVPRDLIKVVCSPAYYGLIRNHLDGTQNANISTAVGEFGMFHGVDVFSSTYLPTGVDFIVMVVGSVAQPALPTVYNPSKIPLSDATAFGMFLYFGTKAVASDLIIYHGTTYSA